MNHPRHSDPAEQSALMRLLYRHWRTTRLGRRLNRFSGWWFGARSLYTLEPIRVASRPDLDVAAPG
jgi:hypothetical protein